MVNQNPQERANWQHHHTSKTMQRAIYWHIHVQLSTATLMIITKNDVTADSVCRMYSTSAIYWHNRAAQCWRRHYVKSPRNANINWRSNHQQNYRTNQIQCASKSQFRMFTLKLLERNLILPISEIISKPVRNKHQFIIDIRYIHTNNWYFFPMLTRFTGCKNNNIAFQAQASWIRLELRSNKSRQQNVKRNRKKENENIQKYVNIINKLLSFKITH